MPDYQNGTIYKLWCVDNDLVYYGSTVQPLYQRLHHHKCKSNDCKSKLLFESSTDVRIELVEKFACNDKNELNAREGYYIRNYDCVNKKVSGRTQKEYRQEHKEEIAEYNKQYHQENKEERNKKATEKIKCECGAEIIRAYLAAHRKTKKHLDFLNLN